MAQHSNIVGGSTAKRVIACPGSVKLVQQMPPKPSSKYADEGTLLHNAIADVLGQGTPPASHVGTSYQGVTLTEELYHEKLIPALQALDEVDPHKEMEFQVEAVVGFGDALPDVFGSADLIGRIGRRAVVLDWKFGSGVAVDVEENAQAMFYAAAAMRTDATKWAFKGAEEIELVIVQPAHAPNHVKRWVTTPGRILNFERELFAAVKTALMPNAPLASGDHCRWCAAKPVCPSLTGAVDRAVRTSVKALDVDQIAAYLRDADVLEQWLGDLRALAQTMMEEGVRVPGYKLVPKRATRKWADDDKAKTALSELGLKDEELMQTTLLSPSKVEKVLKKRKINLPRDLVVSVSTGNTIATVDDPRPEVLQIGRHLTAALGKLS
jgi:hypothetical protein